MRIIILAGGKGIRLWPLSRDSLPKQFLPLGGKSLFERTIERVLEIEDPENIFVSTNNNYYFFVNKALKGTGIGPKNIIVEPSPKNTGPAILFTLMKIKKNRSISSEEPVLVCPSDHLISPTSAFIKDVRKAETIASSSHIVTFGIEPNRPETGYGYIGIKKDRSKTKRNRISCYQVERFLEKPSLRKAKEFLRSGNYLWNSGMFLFPLGLMIDEFKRHAPEVYKNINDFSRIDPVSIDKAVIEKTDKVAAVAGSFKWSDVGSWHSFHDFQEKDRKGNVMIGNVLTHDVEDSLILGSRRLVTCLGLRNIAVIETEDAVFVAAKDRSQEVKTLVEKLQKEKRKEANDGPITVYSWGSCAVLEEKEDYIIKKLTIASGKTYRPEPDPFFLRNWMVLKGKAKVMAGKKEHSLKEGESFVVSKGLDRGIRNGSKRSLEIFETIFRQKEDPDKTVAKR